MLSIAKTVGYGPSYIGVTGLMTAEQVRQVASAIPTMGWRLDRPLMLGILMSSKTANGIPNKYPKRYPRLKDVFKITDPVDGGTRWNAPLLPIIHYATDDHATVALQILGLKKCLDWEYEETVHTHVSGFQINTPWPDLRLFHELGFESHFGKNFRIVLQVGRAALKQAAMGRGSCQPDELVTMLRPYVGAVSDILLDPSGGMGMPVDPAQASDYLDAIKAAGLRFGLGVAGGLDAQSLDQLAPLLERHPDVSIDAEGRLRDPATDELDLGKARDYVAKAYELFEGKRG